MPIVTGSLTISGAVVDLLVGVSPTRQSLLERVGFSVPKPIAVRALIDTGANITGIASHVFAGLDLTPVGERAILTPSTTIDRPHLASLYQVTLAIVANAQSIVFGLTDVIAADGWHPDEGVDALIGRDVLDRCVFEYFGPSQTFRLSI